MLCCVVGQRAGTTCAWGQAGHLGIDRAQSKLHVEVIMLSALLLLSSVAVVALTRGCHGFVAGCC